MNVARRGACFMAVTLAVWTLGAPEGFTQDQATGDVPAEPSSSSPAEPGPTSAPRAGEAQAAPAEASEAPHARVIEEILVTAQRTEQQLHDVPISMSALDSSFMRQQGVTDLQDVAKYVPNLRVDLTGTYVQPRIRGFSTNTVVNRGLELPVGIVIDEVPYSRGDYFASGLFDLERVEVLRGPQGQLFGANTTVGLLNLTTRNPTDEYTGYVDGELGELDSRRFEGGVGGPILRGFLNFRIAALSDERDGYVRNTTKQVVPTADDVFGDRIRRSVRAKLDLPSLLGGGLTVSYQRDHLAIGPTARELTFVPEKFRPLLREYDPNVDITPDNLIGSLDAPSFRDADIDTVAAKGRYDLAGWGLNVLAGWSRLSSSASDDSDSAPWDATFAIEDESSRQTTFEFRVTSPDLAGFLGVGNLLGRALGSTDFTSGFFFQRRTQKPTDTRVDVDATLFLVLTGLSMLPAQGEVPVPRPPSRIEFFTTSFEQTADEFSGYGQMNWHFIERWTLLYGMRLDYTAKDASWIQEIGPDPTAVVLPQFIDEFTDTQSRDEFHFAPKVGVKFDWTDDLNLYGNWSKGFQAGGFNNFSTSEQPETRIVEPALVESWEAGTKTRLLGGTAELNLGLFWMTMEDFQLFTLGTTPGESFPVSHVVNVGTLRARGVEVDSTWLSTEWLTLRGALGFNDTEYLEFPIGTCIQDRQDTDGDGDPRCDLKGRPLEQAPKWDVSVTPSVRVPLTSIPGFGTILPSFLREVDLTQALTVQWIDNRYLNDSDDPRTRQPSFFWLDGNIGFANASQGWSLQFRVENLTDERVHNTAFEAVPANGSIFKAPSPPRLMYGGFRWEF